jgi:hypothetical protein
MSRKNLKKKQNKKGEKGEIRRMRTRIEQKTK